MLIDGQQRITALSAAIAGNQVLDEHYKWKRITIAFDPIAEKFEVTNPAIRKSPRWIPDISAIFQPAFDSYTLLTEYCANNHISGLTEQFRINGIFLKLRSILNSSIGVVSLSEDLDIEAVTQIFIRINSKGAVLSQADFAMSKISSNEVCGGVV